MKEYIKPELEVINFATEIITENEQGNVGTYDDDGGL